MAEEGLERLSKLDDVKKEQFFHFLKRAIADIASYPCATHLQTLPCGIFSDFYTFLLFFFLSFHLN